MKLLGYIIIGILLLQVAFALPLFNDDCGQPVRPYWSVALPEGRILMIIDNNGDLFSYVEIVGAGYPILPDVPQDITNSFAIKNVTGHNAFVLSEEGMHKHYSTTFNLNQNDIPEGYNNFLIKRRSDNKVLAKFNEFDWYLAGDIHFCGSYEGMVVECSSSNAIGDACGGGTKYAEGLVVQEAGCGEISVDVPVLGIPFCEIPGADCLLPICAGLDWYLLNFGSPETMLGFNGDVALSRIDGGANTADLVSREGIWPLFQYDPAKYCNGFTMHGFEDWYLPAIDELETLFNSRDYVGGFLPIGYWSSTQVVDSEWYVPTVAWAYDFGGTRGRFHEMKNKYPIPETVGVRCIRKY